MSAEASAVPVAVGRTAGGWRAHLLPVLALIAVRLVVTALVLPARFGGDTWFFYALAGQSALGRLPLVHFWIEYPPLYPWITVGYYQLAAALAPENVRFWFTVLLLTQNILLELGTLVLVYALAARLDGRAQAMKSGLLYALLITPVIFAVQGMIEPLPEFLLLTSLAAVLAGRGRTSGLLAGVGVLAKVYPGAVLPAALALLPRRQRVYWVAAASAVVVIGLLPFVIASPHAVATSLRLMASRPPYETPWVLLEGCCWDGTLVPPAARGRDMPALPHTNGLVPWPVFTLLAVAAFGFVFLRRRAPADDRAAVSITLFTVALMLVWSKGFSPQYAQWMLPLLLIALPGRGGILLALAFSALTLLENATILPRDPQALARVYVALVTTRTLLTLAVAVIAARRWLAAPAAEMRPDG